jgi:hypothetical protein
VITATYDRAANYNATYDGTRTESSRLSSEIMERLVELHELRMTSAADLCRRLGTLADLSPTMFLVTLRLGSGDVSAVRQSFGEMAAKTGRTRQALHYEWTHEIERVRIVFPALAQLMTDYRQATDEADRKDQDQAPWTTWSRSKPSKMQAGPAKLGPRAALGGSPNAVLCGLRRFAAF